MARKNEERQRLIRHYKEVTGKTEVDMKEVAKFAVSMGWKLPPPTDPIVRLAKEFAQAASTEFRTDKKTGHRYRANIAYAVPYGDKQLYLWIDVDEAPRKYVYKSLVLMREQTVCDVVQISLIEDHWNSINPSEVPINLPQDFTDDVLWRKNAPEIKKAS